LHGCLRHALQHGRQIKFVVKLVEIRPNIAQQGEGLHQVKAHRIQ
jgi:hypothetical protein